MAEGANGERDRLLAAGSLHWFHWAVVAASLVLTLGAWQLSRSYVEEKRAQRFRQEAERAVGLVVERMQKYEDALWAGVGTVHSHGGDVDLGEWAASCAPLWTAR